MERVESSRARRHKRTHLQRRLAQVLVLVFLIDLGVMVAASSFAWAHRGGVDAWWSGTHNSDLAGNSPLMIAVWALTLLTLGAYDTREFGARFDEFRALVLGTIVTLGLTCFIGFLSRREASRGYVLLTFSVGLLALVVVRYIDRKLLHWWRGHGGLANRTIAVGTPAAVADIVAVLAREPWTGYHVMGMCTDSPTDAAALIPVLGTVADLPQTAVDLEADTVLVAGGSYRSANELRRLGWAIEGLDLDMLVVPALTDIAGPRVHLSHVAGLPLVHVQEPRIAEAKGLAKRIFDLTVSLALVFFLSIPMLVTALIIKLQDGGPVLYRQLRIGTDGQPFDMLKFRSMVVGADQIRNELELVNEGGEVLFKLREDPRITRFGSFIRRYSIDELPQLFNVIRGDMSLVGPRPPLPDEVEKYDEHVHRRLMVRPGITGLWQVSGRSDLSWEESVRLDLYYVDNWSLTSDFVILLKTVRAVLVGHGAY